MEQQLSLSLSLRDEATFDNFLAPDGSSRAQLVRLLSGELDPELSPFFLWGGAGSGRRHLMQAACHHFLSSGDSAQYLPLEELLGFDPDSLLAHLERLPLVCVEGVEHLAGQAQWQRALFNLCNAMKAENHALVISADRPPRALELELADLQSRLGSGLVFHLEPYADDDKRAIVRFRAERLGIEMGDDVAAFILSRGGRDLPGLMNCLGQLDRASLEAKRRVTIPFVKQIFGW